MAGLTPEQWEEVQKGFAANRAAQEAMEAKRRVATGEVDLDLLPASDDPAINDPKFQAELNEFVKALHAADVQFSQSAIAMDSAVGGGYPLAEFVIKTLGTSAIAATAAVLVAWVRARVGRKIKVKIGNITVEAHTEDEVTSLLQKIATLQAEHKGKKK